MLSSLLKLQVEILFSQAFRLLLLLLITIMELGRKQLRVQHVRVLVIIFVQAMGVGRLRVDRSQEEQVAQIILPMVLVYLDNCVLNLRIHHLPIEGI